MKLFFDPETHKLIDITAPTPVELNYHYADILDDQAYPCSYDIDKRDFYRISPLQLDVGNVPADIFFPEMLRKILSETPSIDCFIMGYEQGQTDGYIYQQRHYMEKLRHITWSFLIGYEYGVLVGCYLRNHKLQIK